MLKAVNTERVSSIPNAPFSQSIVAGNLLFVSGQIGTDSATGKIVEGGVQAQAEAAIQNLGHILAANGISFSEVAKTTCFLTQMSDFAAFNEVYSKYFTGKPARSCFAVKELPLGATVELEAIAYLG